jgi:hypothetical protein
MRMGSFTSATVVSPQGSSQAFVSKRSLNNMLAGVGENTFGKGLQVVLGDA